MKSQRILKITIALLIVLCSLFSMTSCLIDIGAFYQDMMENQGGDEGGWTPGTPIFPNPDNDSKEDNKEDNKVEQPGEFYPGSGSANTENVPALQQTLLSTVSIISTTSSGVSAGSGIIYSIDKEKGDAFIITNYHVVYDKNNKVSSDISVYLFGMELSGYAIPATYVGGSNDFDVAVLHISGSKTIQNSYAKAVTFGDSDKLHIFDSVYVVGNPEGFGIAATSGMISVVSEELEIEGANGSDVSLRVIRIDAAVNGGNSGGGLYDANGQLIGIVCAKRIGDDIDNIGYAIPSGLVKNLADNIIYHCFNTSSTQVNRAMMGVTITAKITGIVVDPETGNISEAEIVEITEVSAGSLAEGKLQAGDVINSITVDGKTITVNRLHHVTDHMLNARVGSTVVINITRAGQSINITFTISQSNITLVS